MIKTFKTLCISVLLFIAIQVTAQDFPEQFQEEGLNLVGEARLKFLFWPVYKARLLSSSNTFEFPSSLPFALEIEYLRGFSRQDLVKETNRQWSLMGLEGEWETQEDWLQNLDMILRDVKQKDVITLYVNTNRQSLFYFNGRFLGVIDDPDFSIRFASIWLSNKTSKPDFRKKLLGLG